jgi:hypothetical protein
MDILSRLDVTDVEGSMSLVARMNDTLNVLGILRIFLMGFRNFTRRIFTILLGTHLDDLL